MPRLVFCPTALRVASTAARTRVPTRAPLDAIGGALASQAYYGGGYYDPGYGYGQDYYDNGYYDDGGGVVAVAPGPGGDDSTAYCMQRYRSYDPQSGTYLGNDGYRHPCP